MKKLANIEMYNDAAYINRLAKNLSQIDMNIYTANILTLIKEPSYLDRHT